jgi:hypothetical protein
MASRWKPIVVVLAAAATIAAPAAATGGGGSFVVTPLFSNNGAPNTTTDTNLVNAWGLGARRLAVVGLRQRRGRLDPLQRQRHGPKIP